MASSGPLTPEQIKTLSNWMEARGCKRTCPSCNKNVWEAPGIFSGPTHPIPMVIMICRHCAYTKQYAATVVGLS